MSISSETSSIEYTGNNSSVVAYTIPFKFFADADIECIVIDADGVETELALTTNFTLTGANEDAGGELLTVSPWGNTNTIRITRKPSYLQPYDLEEGQTSVMATLEKAMDRIVMLTQRLARSISGFLESGNNLSDVESAATSRTNLGVEIGVDVQAHSSVLDATTASFTTADETKLDGIAAGAQVNVDTDLSYTASTRVLASSTGDNVILPFYSASEPGLVPQSGGGTTYFLRADGTWTTPPSGGGGGGDLLAANNLSDVANAATARTNLGLAIGTNVQAFSAALDATTASFTTADETKLDGIETGADVTDTANVTAAGALMDSELTDLAAVKAFTPSGYVTPTGIQTLTNKTLTNPNINNYVEGVVAIGNTGTTQTLALTSGTVQTATLTGNCTFTMPTATAGKSFVLYLKTGAGAFTGTFTSVKWAGGTAPTITVTASRMDILSFFSDGTNWYGTAIQNFTP